MESMITPSPPLGFLFRRALAATAMLVFTMIFGPAARGDDLAEALALLDDPLALEARLAAAPGETPALYALFADALETATDDDREHLGDALVAVARARAARLTSAPPTDAEIALLGAMLRVHPRRFAASEELRRRVLEILPRTIPPETSRALRERLLDRLQSVPGIDFDALESIALAWDVAVRSSRARRLDALPELVVEPSTAPLATSIYSFPSDLIAVEDAARFLSDVRAAAPERRILVLVDLAQRRRLDEIATRLAVDLATVWGGPYSPWPRDPLTFVRPADGSAELIVLLRPNAQLSREADVDLGRALVQSLPTKLDEAWGGLRWRRAEVPFHNGQVLFSGGAAWISLHTLEVRILELLGLDRVPVEGFGDEPGARYLDAAHRAADELAKLYGRPVRWVHPLPPADAASEARRDALLGLGGGAGHDLDSLVTLLEVPQGPVALVGDPRGAARQLLETAPTSELDAFAALHHLAPRGEPLRGEPLRRALLRAQDAPRAQRLGDFLDVVAEHLGSQNLANRVERLPLLLVPHALLSGASTFDGTDFLIGWNNVVTEHRAGARRAEGFSSGLASGDTRARQAFARAGYALDLFTPLVESVLRGGGYRCASQHVREATAQ